MRLIRLAEAAELTNLSTATIRRLISTGELPAIRASSRSIRIAETDLQAFLERRRIAIR
jgi:excisionase family DNA binding protein